MGMGFPQSLTSPPVRRRGSGARHASASTTSQYARLPPGMSVGEAAVRSPAAVTWTEVRSPTRSPAYAAAILSPAVGATTATTGTAASPMGSPTGSLYHTGRSSSPVFAASSPLLPTGMLGDATRIPHAVPAAAARLRLPFAHNTSAGIAWSHTPGSQSGARPALTPSQQTRLPTRLERGELGDRLVLDPEFAPRNQNVRV